jgi:hypothetical protein
MYRLFSGQVKKGFIKQLASCVKSRGIKTSNITPLQRSLLFSAVVAVASLVFSMMRYATSSKWVGEFIVRATGNSLWPILNSYIVI